MSRLVIAVALVLSTAILRANDARADEGGVRNHDLVALATAVAAGATNVPFVRIDTSESTPFVVPTGKRLVLTDYVCSPQAQGGTFGLQINASSAVFTTQLTFVASSSEPSSFRVHLSSGTYFVTGGEVLISMLSGPGPLNCYAYGYLEQAGRTHGGW